MGTEVNVIEVRKEAFRKESTENLRGLINISNMFLAELDEEYREYGYQVQIAKDVLAERGIEIE